MEDMQMPDEIIASYNRGKIQLTDRNIRIKKLFGSSEIPYHSAKGLIFESCSMKSFRCKFKYLTVGGKEKEIKVIESDDTEPHRVYAHILQTCNNMGLKVGQYPCPTMMNFQRQFKSFGLKCEFSEPDVDSFLLSIIPPSTDVGAFQLLINDPALPSSLDVTRWEIDLGGYTLDNPLLKEVQVKEIGEAEYKYVYDSTGSGRYVWVTEKKYDSKYVIRDSQPHNIDCRGIPQKDTSVRAPAIDFLWGPVGSPGSQRLNDDSKLREMLMKTKVPEIKLKYNYIHIIDKKPPSDQVLWCIERIADHMQQAPIYVEREEPATVKTTETQKTTKVEGPICGNCGKPIRGLSFKTGDGQLLCARCKTKTA